MKAPDNILTVWKLFDSFPMETITKAWFLKNSQNPKQRSVGEIKEHRRRFGASGNCFDLAILLMDELRKANIEAYYVGEDLRNYKDHVAVVSLDSKGQRFLCDLGDLWIQPVNLDSKIEQESGFFAGAQISIKMEKNLALVQYFRPNGKIREQSYDLTPVPEKDFLEAAHICQQSLSKPLIEMRVFEPNETIHWEFENYRSFFSTMSGLQEETELPSKEKWCERIEQRTNIKAEYALECLTAFEDLSK